MTQRSYPVSVLILREAETWVTQCLEYDIAAQGKTITEAMTNFQRTFIGQILVDIASGREPLEGVPQALPEYWKLFEAAHRLVDRSSFYVPEESLPPAYIIRAAAEELRISA